MPIWKEITQIIKQAEQNSETMVPSSAKENMEKSVLVDDLLKLVRWQLGFAMAQFLVGGLSLLGIFDVVSQEWKNIFMGFGLLLECFLSLRFLLLRKTAKKHLEEFEDSQDKGAPFSNEN